MSKQSVRQSLTQERLKEVLDYDPETGVFTWRRRNQRMAGCVDNGCGYVVIRVDGHLYRAHRLAWLYAHGTWPVAEVDHINRDRADNRLINLRGATRAENSGNASLSRANSSGAKGVSWVGLCQKWQAYIRVNGEKRNLGYFSDVNDAAAAYAEAAKKHFGEFAAPIANT